MPFVKYLLHAILLCGAISLISTSKHRPLVFVLCLKGFRWDLPYAYSDLPNLQRLATTGSRALWVESEFGGTQTNIFSLISGLHVEHHARRDFIDTIPVLNEHVGGHTQLVHWPWFDREHNTSVYGHLRSGRKRQPEVLELYSQNGRMSLQRLIRRLTSIFDSLTNENDRTNLIMSFIDEPFLSLTRHGTRSDSMRRTMLGIDRLIGRLLTFTIKNQVNLIVLGDHGVETIDCRQPVYLYNFLPEHQLKSQTERYSGTRFSFVLYPKTDYDRQVLINQLQRLANDQIDIYSNDQPDLPPKLRLPRDRNKPPAIIVFAKEKVYFSYTTEQNALYCQENQHNCPQQILADHSDDPRHLSMRTAFLAQGPLFKKGYINEPILITDIYALLRQILCLSPFPSSRTGIFHVHDMLDLTSLSNTCARLYLSNIDMIKSVSSKPIHPDLHHGNDYEIVQINITERHQIQNPTEVKMRVIVD